MSNLSKKSKVSSIGQIASLIRKDEGFSGVHEREENEKNAQIKDEEKKRFLEKGEKENDFLGINSEIEAMIMKAKTKERTKKAGLAISEDVYNVFAMLKAKRRVPAGDLISVILADWIDKNRDDIDEILELQ